MNPTDQRLQTLFREFFGDDSIELKDEMTFQDIAGWDSIAHVNLINTMEAEFGLKFGIRDLMGMTSVGAIRRVVGDKLATGRTTAQ
jgi:acyl carrier protein